MHLTLYKLLLLLEVQLIWMECVASENVLRLLHGVWGATSCI